MLIDSVCALMTLVWAYQFFLKKNYFGALTYIWAGVFVPLFLYQLGWSRLINTSVSGMFNYIFIWLAVITLLYLALARNRKPRPIAADSRILLTETGKMLSPVLNGGFLILYLLENYLGSGSLVPALQEIDIHTYSAPVISYLTNTPFLVVAFDYYAYKATRELRYWLWILMIFATPIVTRSSRLQLMINAVQFVSLLLFVEASVAMKSRRARKRYRQLKRSIVVLGAAAVIGLIQFTNYRMNHYGVYSFQYADLIEYDGPKALTFLAPYYGYFPLSFNNLKINILKRSVPHNYIGLYSFTCFFFGLLQLDNLLGISTQGHIAHRLVTHGAATVPTGFWDFYYDYGILCFIPIAVGMMVCYRFLKRAKKEKRRLTYRTLYFWFVPLWFFMSFQNILFGSTIMVAGILIKMVIRRSFVVKEQDENLYRNDFV